jgi:type II secretory pathway component GspD/PulD (secretin)
MYLQFGLNRNLLWFFLMASLLLLICPVVSSASELNQNSNEKLENKVKYELSIKNNLITLNAKDAALKKILEDIGQRMNIEVFARIPAGDKITIQFANLTLEEALKKFKANYAYLTDSKENHGNITHVVVVPEGQQANLYLKEVQKGEPKVKKDIAGEKTSKPEPFKFEFDPSKFSTAILTDC